MQGYVGMTNTTAPHKMERAKEGVRSHGTLTTRKKERAMGEKTQELGQVLQESFCYGMDSQKL